ncbi:MAG: FAD-dependent oxidoreductase [Pigmentiphaga sp.]|nr:FAD-dependent oxidoreductase [Pigmentiphaga sp.]
MTLPTSPADASREAWDLIVVGGGVAGLVAANRAAERGRRVLLLEKGEDECYPCNTRFSGGAFHIAMNDVFAPPEQLHDLVMETTGGTADPALLARLIEEAPATLRWLQSHGVRFGRVPAINQQNVLLPLRPNRPGIQWPGRGGDVFVRQMGSWLQRQGGTLWRGATARRLIPAGSRVSGVEVGLASGTTTIVSGQRILLADGGYQADPELLERYVTPAPARLQQRNAGSGNGAGLRMAVALGAALRGMDGGFYGHLLAREALANEALWPFPILDFLAMAGLVVDQGGRRFCDETQGGVYLANAVARLDDPAGAHVIFDDAIWREAGAFRAIPPNPHLILAGGQMHSANSLDQLAGAIGLPPDALLATVDAYHQAWNDDTLTQLNPPRARTLAMARPLRHPPFHAIPLVAGITYTLGGIAVDADARVLRPDGTPIPGLYAAGATTGGLEGGPHSGYVGGLMKSAVFGWLAGDQA